MSSKNLPDDVTKLFNSVALSAQPEDIVADAYHKLSPAQKARFSTIVETLRAEYPEGIDMVQLSMAALAVVIQTSALAHFVDVINASEVQKMSEEEVLALDYARKLYNENFNNVIKSVDGSQQGTNFLKELEEFRLKHNADGSIEFSAKKTPKLKLSVIDTTAEKKEDAPK